jgi:Glycosyltransferase
MTDTKRILLVYKFNHPDVEGLRAALAEVFPGRPIDLLNIKSLVRSHPGILALNIFYLFSEYPLRQLLGYWKVWRRFWATTYIHQQVRRLVNRYASEGNYLFTIQTQADFDAACPGLPNFIYTDTTNLANTYTPGYTEDKLYSAAWRKLEEETYRNARLVFVRSSHIRRSLLEQYHVPSEKAVIAYAGCNTPLREVDFDQKDYKTQNILFVGVAWERKGGPDLAAAFQKVLRDYPQATLTIVGCAPKIDCPNVEIAGRVPVEQVAAYYQKASIFCLPTRLEPFGVVFVEAMAYGLPLVAPRSGAVPDFVEDGKNGFMVEPGDIDGLASALERLLADSGLCWRFGKAGYQLARERYTWKNVGRIMQTAIQPILAGNERENA